MKKLPILLLLLFACTSCSQSPDSVVKSFLNAVIDEDYDKAQEYTNLDYSQWREAVSYFEDEEYNIKDFKILDTEIDDWDEDEKEATVDIKLFGNIYGKSSHEDCLFLVHIDGKWLISDDSF